jgi:Spy/CpxP family protein refolding chaperone
MKPMNKRITAITLSALLAMAAGGAVAFGGSHQRHGDCDPSDMHARMPHLSRLDNLSDTQKDQLKQIRRETRDVMRDLRNEMRGNKDSLRDSMADNAAIENIRTLAKKQGDMVAKMIVLRAETREKIRNVLTDEQRAQFDAMPRRGDSFGSPRDKMRF